MIYLKYDTTQILALCNHVRQYFELVQQSQDEAQHIPSKHTISTSFTH
jgi:hypothetical protein